MAGVTDLPFRTLCRRFGAGLYVNQMLTARALVEGHAPTRKLAEFGADESPRSAQLYGTDPHYVDQAVRWLIAENGVDHIDMNFGCPAPKVTRNGGGAALPIKRTLLRSIVRAAVKAAGDVPVTLKFRMGVDDDHLTFLETGRMAEAEGVAAVALHARTAQDLYGPPARWEAIGELKEAVTGIPVLGNGDIWTADDAVRMIALTGCDGVVIGRGCLGRPWLFGELAAVLADAVAPSPPTLAELGEVMRTHAQLFVEWRGDERELRQFRKHVSWYVAGWPVGRTIRQRIGELQTLDDVDRLVAGFAPHVTFPVEAARIVRSHRGGPRRVALPQGWLDTDRVSGPLAPEAESVSSGG